MRLAIQIFTVSSFALAGLVACGSDGSSPAGMCSAMVEKAIKCEGLKEEKRAAYTASCTAMAENDEETREQFKAMSDCLKKDSCDEYKSCSRAVRKKRRLAKIAKGKASEIADDCSFIKDEDVTDEIKKSCKAALAYALENPKKSKDEKDKLSCWGLERLAKKFGDDGDKKKAKEVCAIIESARLTDELKKLKDKPEELAKKCDYARVDKLSAEVKKLCEPALTAVIDQIEKATAAGTEVKFQVCYRATSLAKKFGDDMEKKAKAACEANRVVERVKKAIDKAKAESTAGAKRIPFECRWAMRDLEKMPDSEWKTKTINSVLDACYVQLAIVMAEKVESKYFCNYNLKQAITTAGKYKLLAKHPNLAAAFQKHPKCERDLKAAMAQ